MRFVRFDTATVSRGKPRGKKCFKGSVVLIDSSSESESGSDESGSWNSGNDSDSRTISGESSSESTPERIHRRPKPVVDRG